MNRLERIIIVGGSCAGKTTLAKQIVEKLKVPRIELDALHWGPNWQENPREDLRESVKQAVAQSRWVCDGNYTFLMDLTWTRATTLVWLDYSFPLVFRRAVRRTVKRVFLRETIYSGNRETFCHSFCSRESILWWVLKTHHNRHRQIGQLISTEENAHLQVIHCEKPSDTERFIKEITPQC